MPAVSERDERRNRPWRRGRGLRESRGRCGSMHVQSMTGTQSLHTSASWRWPPTARPSSTCHHTAAKRAPQAACRSARPARVTSRCPSVATSVGHGSARSNIAGGGAVQRRPARPASPRLRPADQDQTNYLTGPDTRTGESG